MADLETRPEVISAGESCEWRNFNEDNLPSVLKAARKLFAKYGYHGTSARAIAEAAGLSIAALYRRYPSKQQILASLAEYVMALMLSHTYAAGRCCTSDDPVSRLNNVVECLLRFHMERREDAFIISSEIRSMEPQVRRVHIERRDEQQAMVRKIIEDGARRGLFETSFPGDTARAICSLCVSVSFWYRPDGPETTDTLVARGLTLAQRMVGARVIDGDDI